MNKRCLSDILAELKGQGEKSITRLENELIKTVIKGDVNVRTYHQYKATYEIVDGEEILKSRKFIRFYTEIISLKKPVQRFFPYQTNEKTELQLSYPREQNSQLYMKSNSKKNIYC